MWKGDGFWREKTPKVYVPEFRKFTNFTIFLVVIARKLQKIERLSQNPAIVNHPKKNLHLLARFFNRGKGQICVWKGNRFFGKTPKLLVVF